MMRRSVITTLTIACVIWAMAVVGWADTPEQVWIVSTRRAPVNASEEHAESVFDYFLLGRDGQWMPSTREAFEKSDDRSIPTNIYIHGNRIDANGAIEEAWPVYLHFKQNADGRAFRFVIWSWPSEKLVRRPRRDAQIKVCRADTQSLYLARFVSHIDQNVSVGMVGYSFGARIIVDTLHLLGGGHIVCYGLSERTNERKAQIRVVLIAAALDAAAFMPNRRDELALGQATNVFITVNRCDRVLRFYPRLYGRRGPEALGYVGPYLETGEKIELAYVGHEIGRRHAWSSYFETSALQERLSWYGFLPKVE